VNVCCLAQFSATNVQMYTGENKL